MNIKKRLILSNTILVIVPICITILLMSIFVLMFSRFTSNKPNYDAYNERVAVQSKLLSLRSNILDKKISNKDFETHLTKELKSINGTFVIIKAQQIVTNPSKISEINIEKCKELSNEKSINKKIEINNTPYIIETLNLKPKEESNITIILLAPVAHEVNLLNKFIVLSILIFIISFVITNVLMSMIFSKKIIEPIKNLKQSTIEISKGNLDCSIVEEGDQEIKELCRGFESMRIQLKDSIIMRMKYDNNRKELISSISHDLKTPITSIKGYVEGILDGVANTKEKKEHYLKTIYSKSKHIDHMINDLLLYSKLDLNQIPFNFESVDIVEYFNYCVFESKPELNKYNIDIVLNNNLTSIKFVMLDPDRMKRVILNIIENSKKYMNKEQGKITINLRETKNSIIIELRDNGPGIDENDVNKIFTRFYRTDSARSEAKGSGLGLSIAKQIVEGHSGRIWAINHGNEGTSIVISLAKLSENTVNSNLDNNI